MHHTPLLTTLAAGFVLAFLFGALANRLRISPLVGYLLAGVLAGPFTPGYVADQALSQEIAELGVILLMFGVGLHFSLKDLLSVKAIAIPGALVQIGVATLLGIGLAKLLGWSFGGTLGGKTDGGDAGLLWPLLITLGKVAAFVALMIFGGRRVVPWVLERIAASGSRELFTLAVLAIALGIAYGSAVLFGVSFALGAFFAGMILNESELSHEAAENSLPLRDAFAVLFFVSVGMLFNPMILLQEPLTVLATFLVIVFGKSVAAYLIVRAFGHPNSTALVIAASLAQIGEFSFILIGLGIGLELVPEQSRDLVLAGAILSILVNPLLFIAIDRLQQRKEQRLAEAAGGVREMPAQDLPPPILEREHAVLIGHGRVGGLVSARLRTAGTPFVVVVDKRDKADELREQGYSVVLGNAASPGVLELANIAEARWLLIAIPNGFEAGQIASHARAVNPPLDIVARAHFDAEVDYLEQNGANLVIMGEREIACGMVHRLGLDRDERGADAPLPQSA
ncbi:cation:proton antiporter [Pseudomonas aeruginosa]|uniref:cation:proton antiporter domain-containing protein n=1 Tax=Pseudomonas aeruginosa TaxID=287 RepID=UPI002B26463C|nr:cation:proton antiporter [Pseudomonas aeruginosa]WOX94918.1 cation:proton antiporter [Pseudomonas aeruginosa]HCE0125729.1 cation:proton antiporter [Pseudomonas aeruginosa]HCE4158009.1 cation:proton antiporter [Pseudomonas aeruginosa]HCE4159272.1 cation:proton antiporter [Pseudomonas aeruginosa]